MEKLINIEKIRSKSSQILMHGNVMEPAKEAEKLVKVLIGEKEVKFFVNGVSLPDDVPERIKKAKKEIEKSIENYKKNIPKVLKSNESEKRNMLLIAGALGVIALFGLAYGIIKDSKTLLGTDVFPWAGVVLSLNNFKKIRDEEMQIQLLPDIVMTRINACMAYAIPERIAPCFQKSIDLLLKTYEGMKKD